MPLKTADKINDPEQILSKLKNRKESKQKIVFTNGCFDLLHLGHIDYLEKARNLGDILIVGLNSDASVKRLKGEDRPVNDQFSRARMLAALEFIDAVIIFDADTPLELIRQICPDILVKGGDYSKESIVGADIVESAGGEIIIIPLTEGYSSSTMIKKIKQKA